MRLQCEKMRQVMSATHAPAAARQHGAANIWRREMKKETKRQAVEKEHNALFVE